MTTPGVRVVVYRIDLAAERGLLDAPGQIGQTGDIRVNLRKTVGNELRRKRFPVRSVAGTGRTDADGAIDCEVIVPEKAVLVPSGMP
jgi:hypothetical protein